MNHEEKLLFHPEATYSSKTRGRLDPNLDNDDPYRTPFQRDCHRILYSQPFRRLRHKTQVFFLVQNDHVCTRLEHCLYVAAAARTVARQLGLNEDLAEAIGLGHDLGHAPFGHHGEKVLTSLSKKHNLDITFNHEVHGLKVVDKLSFTERSDHPGLNLSYEVRDGIVSHNGESFKNDICIKPHKGYKTLEKIKIKEEAKNPLTMEGCLVRMIDKIAYAGRDLEDGLTSKVIESETDIPTEITKTLGNRNKEIVNTLITDLIKESREKNYISLSEEKHRNLVMLIEYNYKSIYLTPKVEQYKTQATNAINIIFEQLLDDINRTDKFTNISNIKMNDVYDTFSDFISDMNYLEKTRNEEIVFDFIAGMTDNYVIHCVDKIFIPKYII